MTSHELAKKLLAGPDLPAFILDPSLGNLGDGSYSLSAPVIEVNDAECMDEAEDTYPSRFITLSADVDDEVWQQEYELIPHHHYPKDN